MTVTFADTFFWIALTNRLDQANESAKTYAKTMPWLVTTEEVLTEYLNHFSGGGLHLRQRAALRVRQLFENATVTILPQSSESFRAGFDLYTRRMDKGYSLTDCISMAVMREMRIIDALTNDAHFEQEGFRAIFRKGF